MTSGESLSTEMEVCLALCEALRGLGEVLSKAQSSWVWSPVWWIMMETSQSGKGLLDCGLGALIAGLLPTLSLLFVI